MGPTKRCNFAEFTGKSTLFPKFLTFVFSKIQSYLSDILGLPIVLIKLYKHTSNNFTLNYGT